MATPFISLYLVESVGAPQVLAGALLGAMAVGFVISLSVGGHLADRFDPWLILLLSQVLSGLAYVLLATNPSVLGAALSLFFVGLCGFGQPALAKMLAESVSADERTTVFAGQYMMLNIGLGIGAAAGGFLATALGFQATLLLNSLSFVVFAMIIVALKRRLQRPAGAPSPPAETEAGDQDRRGYVRVLSDRRFLPLVIGTLLVGVAAFAQLESGFPMFTRGFTSVTTSAVGLAWTANTIAVAVLQAPMVRLIKRLGTRRSLLLGVACFALAWLGLFLALTWDTPPIAAMCAALVVFGIGETLFMPTSNSLANDLAVPALRGRYNAVMSVTFAAGDVLGPLAAGILLTFGGVTWVVGLLALFAVAALLFGILRQPPHADQPAV